MSTLENTSSGASPMENDLLLFVCSSWTFSCSGTISVLPIPFKCSQVKGINLWTDLPAKSSEFLSRPIPVDCPQNALINITSCNFHSWKHTLFWPESYEKRMLLFVCSSWTFSYSGTTSILVTYFVGHLVFLTQNNPKYLRSLDGRDASSAEYPPPSSDILWGSILALDGHLLG